MTQSTLQPPDLRALGAVEVVPPFDFEDFEQRRAAVRHRRRAAGWSAAAAVGVLALVPAVALLTQPQPAARVIAPAAGEVMPLADVFRQPPALVDMERFAVTSELEDYIALLDAQISAARLAPVPHEDLRRLETARAALDDSLQRVARAHELLDL